MIEVIFKKDSGYKVNEILKSYEVWYEKKESLTDENGERTKNKKILIIKTATYYYAKIFAKLLNEQNEWNYNFKDLIKIKIQALELSIEENKQAYKQAITLDKLMKCNSRYYKKMLTNDLIYLREELTSAKNMLKFYQYSNNKRLAL